MLADNVLPKVEASRHKIKQACGWATPTQTPEFPGFGHNVVVRVQMLPSTDALALLHQVDDALATLVETVEALPATAEVQALLDRIEQALDTRRRR